MTIRDFMSYGHIVDEEILVDCDAFIRRDTTVTEFRTLVDMSWDRNSNHASKKITFDITVAAVRIQEMIFNCHLPYSSPTLSSASTPITSRTDFESIPPVVTPSLKRSRVSSKVSYTLATLAKYSKSIENKVIDLLATDVPSNDSLRDQVLKKVIARLESRFSDTEEKCNTNEVIIANIKRLILSMNKYGRSDRESIMFKENLALAVTGNLSLVKLMVATGLSRRVLQQGKKMRELFESETSKAMSVIQQEEHVVVGNDQDDARSDVDTEDDSSDSDNGDSDNDDDDDSTDTPESIPSVAQKQKRASKGQGQRRSSSNIYRLCITSKSRKVRSDAITGEEIQRFCHESQWGGRIDTLKLAKQQVIVDQPRGGFEYEPTRSYQFTVKEMYSYFKESEYGDRQRNSNGGRNMSLRRFRELICPCMTKAKQRDTADQIVAEFKQCLRSWDLVRKKDYNVKASISRCMDTDCVLHKRGSSTAALYAAASKTTTNFLSYILCPKINREELAVHAANPTGDTESYESKENGQKMINLAIAAVRKEEQKVNFVASCARKGTS